MVAKMEKTFYLIAHKRTKPVPIEPELFEPIIRLPLDSYQRTSTPEPPPTDTIIDKSVDYFDIGEMLYDVFRTTLNGPPLFLPCRGLKEELDDITGCHLIADGGGDTKLSLDSFDLEESETKPPSKRRPFATIKKLIMSWLRKLRKFITRECLNGKCRDLNCRCHIERSLMNRTVDDRFTFVVI